MLNILYVTTTNAFAEVAGDPNVQPRDVRERGFWQDGVDRFPTYILIVFESSHYRKEE